MFGEHTHREVQKGFANVGIDVTRRTIAKFRRNESAATNRILSLLKEGGTSVGKINPVISKKKD